MKLHLSLFLFSAVQFSSATNLRNKQRRLKKFDESCTGLLVDVQYAQGSPIQSDQYLACETPSGKTYKVVSVTSDWVKENVANGKLKSGETELIIDADSMVDEDTAELNTFFPPGLAKKAANSRRLAVVEGNRSVLVVRVEAADASTGFTTLQLSDSVFGTSGDPVNLKSQYLACSHNKLNFVPASDRVKVSGATGSNISAGAVTVQVSTLTSEGDGVMRNAITAALNAQFGVTSPTQLANHVMYCLPPNTMSGIAYAYINSWNSVYSNQWCTYLSGQMHEIGHNLNLAHSNEAGTYKDQSGMMGYSYSQDDGPLMCFNAAKSWQLPWYNQRKITINSGDLYEGQLDSIISNPDISGPPMLIKVNDASSSTDYYINYNYKAGFNSGTVEGGNQVMIVTAGAEGTGYAESELRAKLGTGGFYSTTVNGESLSVSVISAGAGIPQATVSICLGTCAPITPAPTKSPVTPAPTSSPTASPTKSPVTPNPTASPTASPTKSPVAPTKSPTRFPTASPTASPTRAPTPSAICGASNCGLCSKNQCNALIPACAWSGRFKTCINNSSNPAPAPAPQPAPTPTTGGQCSSSNCSACLSKKTCPSSCTWQGGSCN